MMHPIFDTLQFVEKLKAAGMPEPQAIALARAHSEAMLETTDHFLATKVDIYELKQEIYEVKQELKTDFQELKVDFADLKSNQKLLQWMVGFMMTGTGALIIKTFLPIF